MKYSLFFIVLFYSAFGYSQQDLVAAGTDAAGSGGSVSYSVGQACYESDTGAAGTSSQGVQQPFEIFLLKTKDFDSSFTATIYPNPVFTNLILSMDLAQSNRKMTYELSDITGKVIRNGSISSKETTINVEGIAQNCYFLNVIESNKRVKTFKLIKNN